MLHVEGLCLAWPGQPRLVDGLDLTLRRGQTLALVGPSGCGKSLVARTLVGLPPPALRIVAGAVRLDGVDLLDEPLATLQRVRGRRIGLVFQDAAGSLNPVRTVGAQLVEAITTHTPARGADARQQAVQWLVRVGLADLPGGLQTFAHQLSGGQQQRVAIALALACAPEFLIADEPSSALDTATQAQVFDLLRGLQRAQGLGLLLISHDAALVARHADAVVRMPGAPPRPVLLPVAALSPTAPPSTLVPVLCVRGLRVAYPLPGGGWWPVHREVVHGVSLQLAPGRTLALVGPSGSGKTTVAKAVVQLLVGRARVSGEVEVAGVALHTLCGAALRRARVLVQMVFQDALAAFDPRLTLAESLEEGMRALRPQWSAGQRQQRMQAMLARVGLSAGSLARRPHEVSGGQLQRFALARALVVEPQVLVCDEPTAALDAVAQAELLALLRSLQRETGLALLCISHDAAVVAAVADDVALMEAGRIVACQPVAVFSAAG